MPGLGRQTGLPAKRLGALLKHDGDLLRLSRNVPGDAKPILIDADEITTWTEDGVVVLFLTGQVLVQQSVSQTRFQQGIAWVDINRYKDTGILHMDLYAEGQVRIDTSVELQDGNRAILDLNSRGEFHVRAHHGKVARQDRSSDPLVVRAMTWDWACAGLLPVPRHRSRRAEGPCRLPRRPCPAVTPAHPPRRPCPAA